MERAPPPHQAQLQLLQDDTGLDYLLLLYQFLHGPCREVSCRLLIREFPRAQYVKNNNNLHFRNTTTLSEFFLHLNSRFKDHNRGPRNCGKKSLSAASRPAFQSSSPLLQPPQHSSHHQNSSQCQRWSQQCRSNWSQRGNSGQHSLSCHWQDRRGDQSSGQRSHSNQRQDRRQNRNSCQQSHCSQSQESRGRKDWSGCHNQGQHSHSGRRQDSRCHQNSGQHQRPCPPQRSDQHHGSHHPQSSGQHQSCSQQHYASQQYLPQQHHMQQHSTQQQDQQQRETQMSMQTLVNNIEENSPTLSKVTVGDLLKGEENEKCKLLLNLDHNFILNIINNSHIGINLNEKLYEAITKMKRVRLKLAHANYDFNEEDFDACLIELHEALDHFYQELGLSQQALKQQVQGCREEAKFGNKAVAILCELAHEAHRQYSPSQHGFLPPNIITTQGDGGVEYVATFIESHQHHQAGRGTPMLLCGEQEEEKALLLQSLAFHMVQDPHVRDSRFRLVLYLKDTHRRSWHKQVTWDKNSAEPFQKQVFDSLVNLVPHTVHKYSLDAVRKAIRKNQDNILFLVNWNVDNLNPVRGEMEHGTWLLTHRGKNPHPVDWEVLRFKPYTEAQVKQMLQSCSAHNATHMLSLYHMCSYKDVLSSLDMIKIFFLVGETVTTGTDFEVARNYVETELDCVECDDLQGNVLKLGEIAFHSLLSNRCLYRESDLCAVENKVLEAFLQQSSDGEGLSFKHNIVQDFLVAKYVVSQPDKACKKWLKNIFAFRRVFRFVCSQWCEDCNISENSLCHMKEYLRHFMGVEQCLARQGGAKGCSQEPIETDGKTSQKKLKWSKPWKNIHKNPFESWGFFLQLEEACYGKKKALDLLADLLSENPCWLFSEADACREEGQLTRLEKILKRVKLDRNNPVIIKLKSGSDVSALTRLWSMIKGIRSLHERVRLVVHVASNKSIPAPHQAKLEELMAAVANTHSSVYFTRYRGPLFCSHIKDFLTCKSLRKLEVLEVTVYDLDSLHQVVADKGPSSLREVIVTIDLKASEQDNFIPSSIKFPRDITFNIIIKYFKNIQQLLDCFQCRHLLSSLSIHGLYISESFKLDLSKFTDLRSLNIRCEPESPEKRECQEDSMELEQEQEQEQENKLPRCHWMFNLAMKLKLPKKLKTLLLRNVEFFSDSNHSLVEQFFRSCNINRLLILDSHLSVNGVRKVLCSQTEASDLTDHTRKKARGLEPLTMQALVAKVPRLSKSEREARRRRKPCGKEVVITSEGELCCDCLCFPCLCLSNVERVGCNTFRSLEELIHDMYHCNITSFSCSFNQCTIKKDVSGDLRVECYVRYLNDAAAYDISNSSLAQLFRPLTLAQYITLEETNLSPAGMVQVMKYLRKGKSEVCVEGRVEPFSLTIGTRWHPPCEDDSSIQGLVDFLKVQECFAVLHYWCMCSPHCFHIKKQYNGGILFNNSKVYSPDKTVSLADHQ